MWYTINPYFKYSKSRIIFKNKWKTQIWFLLCTVFIGDGTVTNFLGR